MSWSHTICPGCGANAWHIEERGRNVHEDFYVHDKLWNRVCPDGGCFCIGCFERRLGRRLNRHDFKAPPREATAPWPGPGTPPSMRFLDRWQDEHPGQLTLDLPADRDEEAA